MAFASAALAQTSAQSLFMRKDSGRAVTTNFGLIFLKSKQPFAKMNWCTECGPFCGKSSLSTLMLQLLNSLLNNLNQPLLPVTKTICVGSYNSISLLIMSRHVDRIFPFSSSLGLPDK